MKKRSYMEGTYFWGRVWGLFLFCLIVGMPFALCFIFNVEPNWKELGEGIIACLPLYCTVGLIELFTYLPMLGAGGTYISFITGNISNLKLPCALDALKKANLSASSEEGECISTIAIATSNIVTTIVIIIGVLLIVPLNPILSNPVLQPAFDNILPALFGGLSVFFISKNIKVALPPLILMLVLFIAVPALNASLVSIMVPVGVLFSVGCARFMYKKGMLEPKAAKESN